MAFLVDLAARASRDLQVLFDEKHVSDSIAATLWFIGLERAVLTLENHPRRCPVAPETKKAKRELRHLLYGKKPHVYRIIYEIDQRKKLVHVLTIRHGAMEPADV